jgi:hypothetical protein
VLSNLAGKNLLTSYGNIPTTWRKWCAVRSVDDFKEAKNYRVTTIGELLQLAPSGSIKHVTLQETATTNQAKTYAALLVVDRTHMVNDDLGAFMQAPKALSRLAAIGLEKAVYTLLLANTGNFYHADNDNLLTSGASALSISALSTAVTTMAAQLDENGDPLFNTPKYLLHPPVLTPTAAPIISSMEMTGQGADEDPVPSGNPWANRFESIEAPYLSTAAGLPGSSESAWYLMPEAGDFSPIQVAFLQGNEAPVIEMGDLDYNQLGMYFRCVFDHGVVQFDERGSVKSAGA